MERMNNSRIAGVKLLMADRIKRIRPPNSKRGVILLLFHRELSEFSFQAYRFAVELIPILRIKRRKKIAFIRLGSTPQCKV